ncbi:helix-turn-helix transcriptional regulator [Prauserella flavalba]|uniref:helix-turn-helix transcriptional regulator n=1 Tax=Prauserella flavalba TaxID=1477506 RepID=UPI0036F02935
MTPGRFFSLLLALQSRPATTVAELAREAGVSGRTVVRDLHWLQEAGFPVVLRRGRYGGVTLLPGGALDTARLTPGEREHLALAGLDPRQRHRLGVDDVTRRALRKVVAPRRSGDLLPIGELVTSDNQPWFGREPEGVSPAELIGDLRRGVRLKLTYQRSAEPAPRSRTVDPYGLLAKAGRWYLVADERGEPRLFSLHRIGHWQPLRTPRRLRTGTTLASVAADLTAGWESAGDDVLRLRVDAGQVERAKRILGARLTLGPAEGETVRATLRVRGIEGVRQLLAFGATVTVLDPPEARARLRELALEIAHHYD